MPHTDEAIDVPSSDAVALHGDAGVPIEDRTRHPLLIVFSGPSGAGKDSVIQALRRELPDLHYAVTATTRPARSGEAHGRSYYFLDRREYDALLDKGELLAPAEVHGNWYGAPLQPLREAFAAGKDVLLKIDVQGAIAVRRRFPQATFIFLAPPSLTELVHRLTSRRTEFGTQLDRRIRDAEFELAQRSQYDYIVVNRDDDLDYAVHSVACIIAAERLRTHRQPLNLGEH